MRQQLTCRCSKPHTSGERLFVGNAGQTIDVTDSATGESHTAQVFVAVLDTYQVATRSRLLPEWICSHARTRSSAAAPSFRCQTTCATAYRKPRDTSRTQAPLPRACLALRRTVLPAGPRRLKGRERRAVAHVLARLGYPHISAFRTEMVGVHAAGRHEPAARQEADR